MTENNAQAVALEKIKKLLRLSASSNPNEAALALERAREIMSRHGLDQAAVELAGIKSHEAKARLSRSAKPPRYVGLLARVIDWAYGCDHYYHGNEYFGWRIVFAGPSGRQEVAAYSFDVLARQLARARKTYLAGLAGRQHMRRAAKTAQADAFAEGWVASVSKHIVKHQATDQEQQLLKRYMATVNLDGTLNAKAPRAVAGRGAAAAAGWAAGQKAQLYPAVKSGSDGRPALRLIQGGQHPQA